MPYNPEIHHRRSIRLRGWDYAGTGAYSITLCVRDRECLFGVVLDGEMRLNGFGRIVANVWDDLPNHYPTVALDAFVIMPNHMHGIVVITKNNVAGSIVGADFNSAPTDATPNTDRVKCHTLGEIVRGLKTFSTRRINQLRCTPGMPVWQRNYHEHIVRNDGELNRIRRYITDNSRQWESDSENRFARS